MASNGITMRSEFTLFGGFLTFGGEKFGPCREQFGTNGWHRCCGLLYLPTYDMRHVVGEKFRRFAPNIDY